MRNAASVLACLLDRRLFLFNLAPIAFQIQVFPTQEMTGITPRLPPFSLVPPLKPGLGNAQQSRHTKHVVGTSTYVVEAFPVSRSIGAYHLIETEVAVAVVD